MQSHMLYAQANIKVVCTRQVKPKPWLRLAPLADLGRHILLPHALGQTIPYRTSSKSMLQLQGLVFYVMGKHDWHAVLLLIDLIM